MEVDITGAKKEKDETKYTLLNGSPIDQLVSTLKSIQQATDLSIGEKALKKMEEDPDDFTRIRKKIHANVKELKEVHSFTRSDCPENCREK